MTLKDSDICRTEKHRNIIKKKLFLQRIYVEWYHYLIGRANSVVADGKILEIGSGGGFLKELYPETVTSDVIAVDTVDVVCSAESLPFPDNSLKSIVMIDVFHHIPRPYLFLEEANRCLADGGSIVMIEPANSPFGRFIYTHFHPEPFNVKGNWEIAAGNPIDNSNQALPYIYFERDREIFKSRFPDLKIQKIFYHTPFRYILSGGLSKPCLLPSCFYNPVRYLENGFGKLGLHKLLGLFCTIEIKKNI